MTPSLVRLDNVSKQFSDVQPAALGGVSATIEPGHVTGLVGPDGAGKTTLIRLIDGLLQPDSGRVEVCGFDPSRQAQAVHRVVGYMPQRFGLYEDLSVLENLTLYADLRGLPVTEREDRFERLLRFTDLARFTGRRAGALSGGMKQKLGLACAMIRKPQLLLLDEPSVGVDPLSRRELWRMVQDLLDDGIGVVWSTAYLDEAEKCDHVLVLNEGELLYSGKPDALTDTMRGRSLLVDGVGEERRAMLDRSLRRDEVIDGVIQGGSVRLVLAQGTEPPTLQDLGLSSEARIRRSPPRFEDAFMALLGGIRKENLPERFDGSAARRAEEEIVVESRSLTKRFGAFTAADRISFTIRKGEVFGLLGPNGAGKSTSFRMMCGLLKPTEGEATVAGRDLMTASAQARALIGYMAQKFSLYGDLTVQQNLDFFAGAYGLSGRNKASAQADVIKAFELAPHLGTRARDLPLGFKQRLAMSCAIMHGPTVLFLDEPTSGVDPQTRREFWSHINAMVERGVTIMVTTHFMEEAEYCDQILLMYRGQTIAAGTPDELKAHARTDAQPDPTLEDAFVSLVQARESQDAEEAA